MKRHLLFLFGLIISISLLADVPQGISHQAVMRDANNELVANTQIGIQVSILQGSADGEAVYVETHTPISNANGLITYIIGEGAVESGVFAEIDWSAGPFFLQTEADPDGGTNYSISGVTQFLSVPYAHFSQKAASLTDGEHTGEILYWDGNQWLAIVPGETGQTLTICDGVPTWGPCVFTLSLHANPADGGSVSGQGSYQEGAAVNISAEANTGWEFVNWTGDTEHLDDADSAEAVVSMPSEDVVLTANFQQEDDDPAPGTVTDIDGNVYQTVIIGEQEWMAENLRVTKYNNGDAIPTGLNANDWGSTTSGAYAIYNNDEDMLEAYGKLYNWYAVDDARGLCPEGWSVPSDDEWTQLVDYLISQGYPNESDNPNGAGNALKSCRQVNHPDGGDCDTSEHPRWNSHSTHYGFDEFGFSALPGGLRNTNGNYNFIGGDGFWWSSSEYSSTDAWYWYMISSFGRVYRNYFNKRDGFSVRCIKD